MMIVLLIIALAFSTKSIYQMTMAEFKSMLCEKTTDQIFAGVNMKHIDHTKDTNFKDIYIPREFDARQKFGKCIHPVRNQGSCGSCWAHTTSEVMSDRYCIVSGGSIDVIISPQYIVSCDRHDDGCSGGFAPSSFLFMTETGSVTEDCYPYQAVNGTCNATCSNGKTITPDMLYKCEPNSVYTANDPDSIKIELMQNGPMYVRFDVYDDFKQYLSGIYYKTSKNFLGGHAVKLLGWGKENGIDYWLIQNSWGTGWGENGFFRIKAKEAGIALFSVGCKPMIS